MNSSTLLLRQIHPTFVQNGEVTSQAFRPTAAHEWKLSVYNGDLITAQDSWNHFTTVQQKESAGVLGVTIAECEIVSLPVRESPEVFAEHCDVDFSGLAPKKVEQKGRLLRDRATQRGWQHKANS